MIYTSYFGRLKELEENNLIPIAICGGIPDNYKGRWYRKLAPSWSIYSEYKDSGDSQRYTKRFYNEILSKRNPETVFNDLYNLAGESTDFVLLCYEKPNEFCHRHLVADWLSNHGIPCQEWKNEKELKNV